MDRIEKLQNTSTPWLTDGGLETAMIFLEGIELPHFAAFTMLENEEGRAALTRYFGQYLQTARKMGTGFVLDTPTWRANTIWGAELGLNTSRIESVNRESVAFLQSLRAAWETAQSPIILNGVVGPAGDGYAPENILTPQVARAIHDAQVGALVDAGVDLISAMTMTHTGEAIGIARAAAEHGSRSVIAFTVETDGRLPTGQTIGDAIDEVDAATDNGPLYYMINCAHPDHFRDALTNGAPWLARIGAVRANASRMSHAELDEAEELDPGDPAELASDYQVLQQILGPLKVLGGCCGTDHRHVAAIGQSCVHAHAA